MWRFTIIIILFTSSCSPPTPAVKLLGEAQGTYYSIIYFDSQERDFQTQIDSLLNDFDQSVSLWQPQSILSKVNNNQSNVELDEYFIDNFNLSKKVATETNGAFDFTIAPLVAAWGFGFDHKVSVDSVIVDSLLQIVGYNKVNIIDNQVVKQNKYISFDFNAIAQGYSVDVVGAFLESKQIHNYLIDIGGEIKAKGHKPNNKLWAVGIEKPTEDANGERNLTAIIKLENTSVATSGSYRKYYEKDGLRYSHMINPKTGYPASHSLLSVSIVTNNTALADAYATACMVMGLEESIKFVESKDSLEAFFIFSNNNGDYEVYATDGFNKLITNELR